MNSVEALVKQVEELTELTQAQVRLIEEKDANLAEALRDNLALHRKLAGETMRADQGWERYEQANKSRIALEMEKAARIIPQYMTCSVPAEPAAPQQHAQAALKTNDVKDDTFCEKCGGLGAIESDPGEWSECDICKGTGVAASAQPIAGELPPIPEAGYWLTGQSTDAGIDVQSSREQAQRLCDENNEAERKLQARDARYYDPDWMPSKPEPLFDLDDLRAYGHQCRAAALEQAAKYAENAGLKSTNEKAGTIMQAIAAAIRALNKKEGA